MGASSLTIESVVIQMNLLGIKVGCINVRLWRPFDLEYFIKKIPATCKKIFVLDRQRDFTSNGELLYKEVISCLYKSKLFLEVKNCTYGICGNDLLPKDVYAVF